MTTQNSSAWIIGVRKKAKYADFCPNLPDLGEYLSSLNGKYSGNANLANLFAACSEFGCRMYNEGKKSGIIAGIGTVQDLKRSVQKSGPFLIRDAERTKGMLSDPAKLKEYLELIDQIDLDCAILFNPEGDLVAEGQTFKNNKGKIDDRELEKVMIIKGKNGHDGTKFPGGLYASQRYGIDVIATSEGKHHSTMLLRNGKISGQS